MSVIKNMAWFDVAPSHVSGSRTVDRLSDRLSVDIELSVLSRLRNAGIALAPGGRVELRLSSVDVYGPYRVEPLP